MATQQEVQDKRNSLVSILSRHEKLTKADIQLFRESGIAIAHLSDKHDWFSLRMQIELIDAISSLDKTSSFLAKVGIAVASTGVMMALLQVLAAFKILPR